MGRLWQLGIALAMIDAAFGQVSVLTYHNNNARTGENLEERLLMPANVGTSTFGKLFKYNVDGYVYAQPLYVPGVTLAGFGARNVLFVATEHNTVYAFDADSNAGPNGGLLWQTNLGPSASTPTLDFGNRYGAFDGIVPEVGITSTPVIDQASGTIYVDTFTHEGPNYVHRLHALNITNGVKRLNSPVVSATVPGTGVQSSNGVVVFDGRQQIQRSALTLANGRLFAAYAGYADTDPYHGWVIGFNPATLQVLPNYVWNSTPNSPVAAFGPNAGEAGIWMGGCGLSADSAGSLYVAVGNGSFNAFNNSSGTEYGNALVRFSTSSGLAVADYFVPYNQQFLSDNDLDLGSGGLMLIPDQPGPYPRLLTAAGKEGKVYWMNRDIMTAGNNHYNQKGSSDAVLQTLSLGGGVYSTPAYFNGRVYWAASGDVLASFPITNGLMGNYTAGTRTFPYPGATPSISANGTSNGVVWAVQRSDPAVLVAYDATNLTTPLYDSSQAGTRDQLANGVKFALPTIANGKVYVGGQYAVSVLGLLGVPRAVWRRAHFGTNTNANVAGDFGDPDQDRMPNVFEYAMGTDPKQANTSPFTGQMKTNEFEVSFRRNLSASDIGVTLQESADPAGPWTNVVSYSAGAGWAANGSGVAVTESAAAGAPPDQFVVVSIAQAVDPGRPNAFYRLRLTL